MRAHDDVRRVVRTWVATVSSSLATATAISSRSGLSRPPTSSTNPSPACRPLMGHQPYLAFDQVSWVRARREVGPMCWVDIRADLRSPCSCSRPRRSRHCAEAVSVCYQDRARAARTQPPHARWGEHRRMRAAMNTPFPPKGWMPLGCVPSWTTWWRRGSSIWR